MPRSEELYARVAIVVTVVVWAKAETGENETSNVVELCRTGRLDALTVEVVIFGSVVLFLVRLTLCDTSKLATSEKRVLFGDVVEDDRITECKAVALDRFALVDEVSMTLAYEDGILFVLTTCKDVICSVMLPSMVCLETALGIVDTFNGRLLAVSLVPVTVDRNE